ncbi:MAG: hypothetical protein ABI068_16195 [Ktedonobacterales bacterium]
MLRAEHAQLQAEHALALNEREQYRSALATTTPANETEVASMPVTPVSNETMRPTGNDVRNTQEQTTPTSVAPSGQPTGQPGNVQDGQQHGGWRGAFQRLRAGENVTQDETRTPNAPPASVA